MLLEEIELSHGASSRSCSKSSSSAERPHKRKKKIHPLKRHAVLGVSHSDKLLQTLGQLQSATDLLGPIAQLFSVCLLGFRLLLGVKWLHRGFGQLLLYLICFFLRNSAHGHSLKPNTHTPIL